MIELVRRCVAEAAETDRYDSPYGGIVGSFRRRAFELGIFQKPNGTLSKPVIVAPDSTTHWRAVLGGVARALSWRLFLSVYAPLLLAILALLSTVV